MASHPLDSLPVLIGHLTLLRSFLPEKSVSRCYPPPPLKSHGWCRALVADTAEKNDEVSHGKERALWRWETFHVLASPWGCGRSWNTHCQAGSSWGWNAACQSWGWASQRTFSWSTLCPRGAGLSTWHLGVRAEVGRRSPGPSPRAKPPCLSWENTGFRATRAGCHSPHAGRGLGLDSWPFFQP